ncbi:piggyBac transposable element-derived protein 4 [Cololabis saira]|uniref:piggyBac transposable element-derived protein 4 n=1 Tax=Cololabis saira TaxID=129043 RepID=UPI002AD30675|nr:piggyBac transposable element-derived protein 4 [Cololabis saira]
MATRKTDPTVQEALEFCFLRREGDEGDEIPEEEREMSVHMFALDKQPSEDSDGDWESDVSTLVTKCSHGEDSSGEEQHSPTVQRASASMGGGGRGGAVGASTSTSPQEKWNDVDEPDITPPQPTFRPAHSPGPRLITTATYTPLQLFQMFFTDSILQTITQNTNEFGSTHHSTPSTPWIDVTVQDMLSFMSLIVFMGVVKCSALTDYWRGSELYNFLFPREVMTGEKFLRIFESLHLSNLADDAANEQRRGTASFDRLARIKPLYTEIREACRRNYHPSQEIAINERMVASKAHTGTGTDMKSKPVGWGYKLFVLEDSRNGYTWDFFVDEGKSHRNSGKRLSYESVMELVDVGILGTGYKLFVDDFYTSPMLFRELLQKSIWACGHIRPNRIGFPKTKVNSLRSKSPRGSMRWIRKDSLLFVQWRDTRDVFLCSTLHTAHSDDREQRRVRGADGSWQMKDVSVPPAVKEYNRCMVGGDLSDGLIDYYEVLHKTQKWYKTFFYHFIDIAIVNAFLLHKELAMGKGETPLHQKAFWETLAEQLAEAGSSYTAGPVPPPAPQGGHHKSVFISGTVKCRHCQAETQVKCSSCDVPLCFTPTRDCYNEWHVANNL